MPNISLKTIVHTCFTFLLLTVVCQAQFTVGYTFHGDTVGNTSAEAVSNAGDVNNDGFDDVIVGRRWDDNNGTNSGSARVYSGFDGSVLYTFNGDAAHNFFGSYISAAGDVNADGFDDVIIGTTVTDVNFYRSGSARVHSGIDGSILYTFHGSVPYDRMGRGVGTAGDINGDGFDDVIVGSDYGVGGLVNGRVRIFSGQDGSTLYSLEGDSAADLFGGT